MQKETKYV
jgi:hypothetical protein